MLQLQQIREKATEIARMRLGFEVKDVVVGEDADSEGRPSLWVTIVLKAAWAGQAPGSKLNEISSQLNSYLATNGDTRFAYTHYLCAREVAASNAVRNSAPKRRSAAS